MQKFIITTDGTMRFGDVQLHRDLIPYGDDTCYGGGFWRVDNHRGCIILSGRSYDFGAPEFSRLRSIDTTTAPGSLGYPMFYERMFAGEEYLEPVTIPSAQ